MSSEQTATVVVAAVILHKGEVLLTQRGTSHREPSTSGRWECPGGAVLFGENLMSALEREVKEELGVAIGVGRLLHSQVNTYDSGTDYLVLFYACILLDDRIGTRFALVRPEHLAEYDTLPGTVEAASHLGEVTVQREQFSFVENDVCEQTTDETLHVMTYELGSLIENHHKAKRYGPEGYLGNAKKGMADLISMTRYYCEQKGWSYEELTKFGEEAYLERMEDLRKHGKPRL